MGLDLVFFYVEWVRDFKWGRRITKMIGDSGEGIDGEEFFCKFLVICDFIRLVIERLE